MTTPTATRLKSRLDARRRWFDEWFFEWHHIGRQQTIAIDTFDGGHAQFAGVSFWGTPRDLYWDLVVRGVRNEIIDQLDWVEKEAKSYSREVALRTIDECAGQLATFVRSIRRAAIKKDRILRGDGINFPADDDAGRWNGTEDSDIQRQAAAVKAALFPEAPARSKTEKLNRVWQDHKGLIGFFTLGLALLAFVLDSLFSMLG